MPRPRKYNNTDLLNKSMILFWEKGYSNTSIKDLEKALNITAPSIYHAYGSKESLFLKTIDHYLIQVVEQRINQYLKSTSTPIENIKSFFLSVIEQTKPDDVRVGCLLTNTATELGVSIPEASRKIQQGLDMIKSAFHHELVRANENQPVRTDDKLEEIASTLLMSYQGLLVLSRLDYSSDVLKQSTLSMLNKLEL
ncbi:MAG TPA: TetR/AcrR family transcriptional regulator [Thiothrix sp.]|nr:TetR/AcrR family transcriptional regulator [Thiothrix sp.]